MHEAVVIIICVVVIVVMGNELRQRWRRERPWG